MYKIHVNTYQDHRINNICILSYIFVLYIVLISYRQIFKFIYTINLKIYRIDKFEKITYDETVFVRSFRQKKIICENSNTKYTHNW